MEQMPFNTEKFKKIAGENCVAEDVNYMPRSNIGMKKWEIKARYSDGNCKIVVLRENGFRVTGEIIDVNDFNNRDERNKEIYRLYHECGLSQVFLAGLFNISQSSVSLVVNGKQMKKLKK